MKISGHPGMFCIEENIIYVVKKYFLEPYHKVIKTNSEDFVMSFEIAFRKTKYGQFKVFRIGFLRQVFDTFFIRIGIFNLKEVKSMQSQIWTYLRIFNRDRGIK